MAKDCWRNNSLEQSSTSSGEPCCQESPAHAPECQLLQENRVKVRLEDCTSPASIYSFILPYRLLMLRRTAPATFSRVASLPDHIVQRAGLGEWDVHQADIVNFLRRRCFLAKTFSEEDIHRAIGIFPPHQSSPHQSAGVMI